MLGGLDPPPRPGRRRVQVPAHHPDGAWPPPGKGLPPGRNVSGPCGRDHRLGLLAVRDAPMRTRGQGAGRMAAGVAGRDIGPPGPLKGRAAASKSLIHLKAAQGPPAG